MEPCHCSPIMAERFNPLFFFRNGSTTPGNFSPRFRPVRIRFSYGRSCCLLLLSSSSSLAPGLACVSLFSTLEIHPWQSWSKAGKNRDKTKFVGSNPICFKADTQRFHTTHGTRSVPMDEGGMRARSCACVCVCLFMVTEGISKLDFEEACHGGAGRREGEVGGGYHEWKETNKQSLRSVFQKTNPGRCGVWVSVCVCDFWEHNRTVLWVWDDEVHDAEFAFASVWGKLS